LKQPNIGPHYFGIFDLSTKRKEMLKRIKYLGFAAAILGAVFKMLHLMGAEVLLLLGGILVAGSFLAKAINPNWK